MSVQFLEKIAFCINIFIKLNVEFALEIKSFEPLKLTITEYYVFLQPLVIEIYSPLNNRVVCYFRIVYKEIQSISVQKENRKFVDLSELPFVVLLLGLPLVQEVMEEVIPIENPSIIERINLIAREPSEFIIQIVQVLSSEGTKSIIMPYLVHSLQ